MTTAETLVPIQDADQFIAWEDLQEGRYEFVDGAIVMMTGGTLAHNAICFALRAALDRVRPAGCRVFSENVKLKVGTEVVYPDLLLVCGPLDMRATFVDDAALVAEVLSGSARKTEIDRKRDLYLALPGLRHYLVLSQDEARVEHYSRGDDGILRLEILRGIDQSLRLGLVDAPIPLAAIYADAGVMR